MANHDELIGNYYSEEYDCDGKYVGGHKFRMTEAEKTEDFGDLNFMDRVVSSMISLHAQNATLAISQRDGMPYLEYREETEEGYVHCVVSFERVEK